MTDAMTKTDDAEGLTNIEYLADAADAARETALLKLTAYCRAWRAADGERAGRELDNRIKATTAASLALRTAGYQWMDAEAALAAAQSEED
jgi:hypothetical protein